MQILMFGGNYRKPLIKIIKDRGWRDFKGLQPNELLGTLMTPIRFLFFTGDETNGIKEIL